ncbi:hypothetical protein [Agrobacterium sp.]|uniref:hypothetical protein n=1 Tax=Agrobacterium sp. TaxID=361 RepID=UPI0040334B94
MAAPSAPIEGVAIEPGKMKIVPKSSKGLAQKNWCLKGKERGKKQEKMKCSNCSRSPKKKRTREEEERKRKREKEREWLQR